MNLKTGKANNDKNVTDAKVDEMPICPHGKWKE